MTNAFQPAGESGPDPNDPSAPTPSALMLRWGGTARTSGSSDRQSPLPCSCWPALTGHP